MNQKGRTNPLIVGNLNIRGFREEKDQKQIADDMQTYKIDIMGIQQEHHLNRSDRNKKNRQQGYLGTILYKVK